MGEHPTIGVEEEFLLVDDTGEPVAANRAVAEEAAARGCWRWRCRPRYRTTSR